MPSSELALQLRVARPHAPEGLRERVRALPEPAQPRSFPRPSLRVALVAAAVVVAASLSAAIGYGLVSSGGSKRQMLRTVKGAPTIQRGVAKAPAPGAKGYAQELAPVAPRSPDPRPEAADGDCPAFRPRHDPRPAGAAPGRAASGRPPDAPDPGADQAGGTASRADRGDERSRGAAAAPARAGVLAGPADPAPARPPRHRPRRAARPLLGG